MGAQLLNVAVHTALLYFFLMAGFRLLGRREVAEFTTVEVLVIALVGSAVETSMIGGDVSLLAGLVSAGTLLVLNRFVPRALRRSRTVRRLFLGRPVIVVYDGRLLPGNLRHAGLSEAEVLEGVRQHGYDRLEDLHLAVLEIDGTVSALPAEGKEQKAA